MAENDRRGLSGGLSGNNSGQERDVSYITRDGEPDHLNGSAADIAAKKGESSSFDAGEAAANAAGGVASGLRSFGYGMLAIGRNGVRGAENMARNFFRRLAARMASMGAGLSGFVGGAISPRIGTAIASGGSAFSLVMVALLLINYVFFPTKYVDEPLPLRCEDTLAVEDVSGGSGDADGGDTEENAKYIYGVFSSLGMPDENIAGILGNWSAESNIDPTGVETITPAEAFTIGPRKKHAESVNFLIDKYNPAYGAQFPAIVYSGIGLGQWTNERNLMLRKFAKGKGRDWYELEVQLAFMIGGDDPMRVKQIESMIDGTSPGSGSVSGSTDFFFHKWEGISDASGGARHSAANKWFTKMKGWSKNQADANSVLKLAESGLRASNAQAVSGAIAQCPLVGDNLGGNSDAAEAMVSYSWPMNPWGDDNDGTDMYVWLREQMYPGDLYWASCDRSVVTAVRWSGTDGEIPAGPVHAIKTYLNAEGKKYWTKVGDNVPEDKLKPGDIMLYVNPGNSMDAHIWMFVGQDIIKKVWKGQKHEDGVIASGSLNNRSPTLGAKGNLTDSRPSYEVYRNSKRNTVDELKKVKVPANMKPNQCGYGIKGSDPNPKGGPPCQYKTPG